MSVNDILIASWPGKSGLAAQSMIKEQ